MSVRVRMTAVFIAWLLAALTAAQGSNPASAVNVDRGGGTCFPRSLPPHLSPHQYEPPAPIAGPVHEPHHPDHHGEDQPPASPPPPPASRGLTWALFDDAPPPRRYRPEMDMLVMRNGAGQPQATA
jgi:hypothetical protein